MTFNAAGVQQGATVNGRSRVNGFAQMRAVALQNGGWMAAEACSSPFTPYVYIFNAAGVQQGATIPDFDTGATYSLSLGNLILLSSGNVVLSFVGGSAPHGVSIFVLSPSGTKLVGSGPAGNVMLTGQNGSAPALISLGNDAFGIYPGTGAAIKSFKYANGALNTYQVDIPLTVTSSATNGIRLIPTSFAAAPSGTVTFMAIGLQANTVTVEGRCSYRQSYAPIGVAGASAAQGSAVPVQITGNATLRTGFVQPVSVDGNGGPIPGQRMYVVGNQAVLNGIQAGAGGRRAIN